MTTIILVRHAMCDSVGHSLSGRAPGVSLNAEGQAQAARLARRFVGHHIAAIYTSPLDRACETAAAIANVVDRTPVTMTGLNEIDFGEWTGCTFDELKLVDQWKRFNAHRSTTRIPGGETMLEAQARAVAAVEALRVNHPAVSVVAVSHSDMIKAVLAHYAGIALDDLMRIEIAPASVSILSLTEWGDSVVRLNDIGELLG
ncbi:MAG: histidine phosphatase family protein [Gemmatimonadaceae bacterium]